MSSQPSSAAGGFLLALAIFAGTLIGAWLGQPSAGIVVGVAIGSALAVALWLVDRRRIGR